MTVTRRAQDINMIFREAKTTRDLTIEKGSGTNRNVFLFTESHRGVRNKVMLFKAPSNSKL